MNTSNMQGAAFIDLSSTMLREIQRQSKKILLPVLFLIAACTSTNEPMANLDNSTKSPKVNGTITALVNGESFSAVSASMATLAFGAGGITDVLIISGENESNDMVRQIVIQFYGKVSVGTYDMNSSNSLSGGYTEQRVALLMGWGTDGRTNAGTLTITSITATRIAGTFSFVGTPRLAGTTGTRNVTQGKFDIAFE